MGNEEEGDAEGVGEGEGEGKPGIVMIFVHMCI